MMVDYVGLLSDVDPLFVKFMSAQLLGHCLTKQSYININPERERLNLYVLLIGKSYFGRKTVTQDIISRFYPQEVILPNESSAEKFIVNLAEKPNGVWFYGEFSKILKHIKSGGYLSSIAETLNDLYKYERPEFKRELMNDEYIIKNPYPTFSSTLTPEVLQEKVTPEMLDGGLFGRLILVPGESRGGGRKCIPKEAMNLENDLKKVVRHLERMNLAVTFDISPEGFELIDEIEKELLLTSKVSSVAGRYGQAVIKLSGILCYSDLLGGVLSNNSKNSINSNNSNISKSKDKTNFTKGTIIRNITNLTNFTQLTIEKYHIQEAYDMIKPCLEFAESLYDYSVMNKKHIIKVREYVKKNFPVDRSDVMRFCNIDSVQANEAEKTLTDQEIISIRRFKKHKKTGGLCKPTTYYCLYGYKGDKCKDCKYERQCTAYKKQYGEFA